MEFPIHIRERIEELIQGEDIKALSAAAERLSENYRLEEHISASSKREILAYSAVRMPATFGAVSRALELSLESFTDGIRTVLDAGAGTGSAALAVGELIDSAEITCLERDPNMLALGKQFAENARWINRDITSGIPEKADLVICSYCLNELPEKQRRPVAAALAHAAEKLLLIVEPGTPKAFAELLKTRAELISLGMKIIAPCPYCNSSGECPLPKDDWCHFTARVARSKLHKRLKNADAPFEDEKFCFLAAARNTAGITSENARILRHPVIEPGKITLRLCSENGISDKIITKSSPLFKRARKSDAGDIFPIQKQREISI